MGIGGCHAASLCAGDSGALAIVRPMAPFEAGDKLAVCGNGPGRGPFYSSARLSLRA